MQTDLTAELAKLVAIQNEKRALVESRERELRSLSTRVDEASVQLAAANAALESKKTSLAHLTSAADTLVREFEQLQVNIAKHRATRAENVAAVAAAENALVDAQMHAVELIWANIDVPTCSQNVN